MTFPTVDVQVSQTMNGMLQRSAVPIAASPTVYLMRGLPSSGKSSYARQLAGENGVICETDQFLRKSTGDDGDGVSMSKARQANFEEFCRNVELKRTPIVVDRGNGLNEETYIYVNFARKHGYRIELVEPNTPWWQEIRTLLRYRPHTDDILRSWATELARLNRRTHSVSEKTILDWLDGWIADLSVEELLEHADEYERSQ